MEIAIQKAKDIHESGEIIHFETGCPWKEHLYDLENELKVEKPIKYVLYGVSFLSLHLLSLIGGVVCLTEQSLACAIVFQALVKDDSDATPSSALILCLATPKMMRGICISPFLLHQHFQQCGGY